MLMKKFIDAIGNRNHDLPACSKTVPLRVLFMGYYAVYIGRVIDVSVEVAVSIFRVVCKSTVLALL